jgi:hypothetical protein
MASTWLEIKRAIKTELLGRGLKSPKTRLRALDALETLLAKGVPGFRMTPSILGDLGKDEVERRLTKHKSNGILSGAEKSVLNNIFQVLDGTLGEHARRTKDNSNAPPHTGQPQQSIGHKLAPLMEVVAEILEKEFGQPAIFSFEVQLEWLDVLPTPDAAGHYWEEICRVYSNLVDSRFVFIDQLAEHSSELRTGPQRVDVWFAEPYSFALEFDEDQHFNQHRLRTLSAFKDYAVLPLDLAGYTKECAQRVIQPGSSGFTRLKTSDPLFPAMLEGDKQDNRVRQRAFRDFLKDVIPYARESCNPTWRIGSYIIGHKRNGFDLIDCQAVKDHIERFELLKHVVLH